MLHHGMEYRYETKKIQTESLLKKQSGVKLCYELLRETKTKINLMRELVAEQVGPAAEPVVVGELRDWSHGSNGNIL